MKKFLPFILSTIFIIAANAQNPNLGTGGAQFMQIPIGARAEAMAGAVVGYINDASSVFWNPAGLVKVKNVEVLRPRAHRARGGDLGRERRELRVVRKQTRDALVF